MIRKQETPEKKLAARRRRLARRLWGYALILSICDTAARAEDLNLDDIDGLNTTTIAKKQRDEVWDQRKLYGAEAVAGHSRAFAKPDGIRQGNYIIEPEAGALITYDDNIFASNAFKEGDIRTELAPSVRLKSFLPRHVLDFSLDGKIVDYAEHESQNYADVRGRLDGALHIDHAHTISASLLSSLGHEERNSPEFPFAARDPVEVFHNKAAVGITRDVGRLYGTISGAAESWDFADNVRIDGRPLDLDFRDTQTYSTQLRLGYRISPGFDLVGKVRGLRVYNKGDGGDDLDALGYEALAGLAFETNPLLRWRILGGYGVRDYEKAGHANLTTSLIEGSVEWLPTQRLTIYGTVTRRVNEVGGPDGGASIQSGASLRADYEIYHNLLLNAGVSIREDKSVNDGSKELTYGFKVGLDYYFSKNWLFTFAYEHDVRESDSDSRDMDRNRFMVGAKLRF